MRHDTDTLLRATKEVFGVVFSHPAVIEVQPDCPGDAPGVVIDHALEITPYKMDVPSIAGPREVDGYLLTLGREDDEKSLGEYTDMSAAIAAAVAAYARELAFHALGVWSFNENKY